MDNPESANATPDPILDRVGPGTGISYLYPYQRLVISNILEANEESRAQIVVLPTGSGKTLCFLVPAMLLPGLTIVVYPLLALIDDQRRRMEAAGIACDVLKGRQPRGERATILKRARSGATRCILTNPETLQGERVRRALASVEVSHLVLDEAHCVSEWGDTFRPAYLTLGETIQRLSPRVTTAFTATASPPVLERVREILFASISPRLVLGNPDRPNIAYHTIHAPMKIMAIRRLLDSGLRLPAIVFCRSRKRAEGVARELIGTLGFSRVGAYHAGLSREERAEIESWFFASQDGLLAATCAYGMGVDKANVRSVIHFDLPANVEAFLQESGRAGRDRAPATSVVLWNGTDTVQEEHPLRRERERQMHEYVRSTGCRRRFLMQCLGSDADACFGCTSCTDEHHRETPVAAVAGEMQTQMTGLLRFVAGNPRCFLPSQIVDRLPPDWPEPEREALVRAAVQADLIRTIRRGPWRGRLTTARCAHLI